MEEKGEWVRDNLPFLSRDNFIIAKRKELVRGDVLFDDGPHNLGTYPGITIGMRHDYCKCDPDCEPDFWVSSLLEFEQVVLELESSGALQPSVRSPSLKAVTG